MNPDRPSVSAYARVFPRSDALYRNPGTMRNEQGVARAFPRSDALYRNPGTMRNEQGLVQESSIHLATWNVRTLTRKDNNKNDIGKIVDKDLKNKVVNVKRIGDRLLLIKLVLGEEIINVISTYAPQMGETILDFVMAYDLAIAKTYFKKRDEHLITYKIKKVDRPSWKDCKVIPRESLTTQHRLVVEFKK
ncbi:hypothetical protein AMTRI_Chr06g173720 [Amborella trichopoda]